MDIPKLLQDLKRLSEAAYGNGDPSVLDGCEDERLSLGLLRVHDLESAVRDWWEGGCRVEDVTPLLVLVYGSASKALEVEGSRQ